MGKVLNSVVIGVVLGTTALSAFDRKVMFGSYGDTIAAARRVHALQNDHIEELIVGLVEVVIDERDDDDVRKQDQVGEEAERYESHWFVVDQVRQNEDEGVGQISDEVVDEHEYDHVG